MKMFSAIVSLILSFFLGALCFVLMKDGEHLIIAVVDGILCGYNFTIFLYNIVEWFNEH